MELRDIPVELLEEIFSYLGSHDLWKCLAVSKAWRNAANSNRLWKRHCSKFGIDKPSNGNSNCDDSLCSWAAAYLNHALMPIRNWKFGKFKRFDIPLIKENFFDSWEGSSGVVFYYYLFKLFLYDIDENGVNSTEVPVEYFKPFITKTQIIMNPSFVYSSNYISVSYNNIAIVFSKKSNFKEPFKVYILDNEKIEVSVMKYDVELLKNRVSMDCCLQNKTISNDSILWLVDYYNDNLYVIDLIKDTIKTYPGKGSQQYSRSKTCPYVAFWDDESVTLYNSNGNVAFETRICCWDIICNSNIIAIGNKTTQSVDCWSIKSGLKLMSKNVLYQTDFVVHYNKDVVVLAEKSKTVYRFTCINAVNSVVLWQLYPPESERRCHAMQIVSEYLLVSHSVFSRPKYSLLDLTNGKLVQDGLLPMKICKISNTVWVYLEFNNFLVKSYIGAM